MKLRTQREMRKPSHIATTLAFLVATIVIQAFGDPVAPWDDPNQPNMTRYWEYDFDSGTTNITTEAGNWDPGSDLVWTISDFVTNNNGKIGISGSEFNSLSGSIHLSVPNVYSNQTKTFWFKYDWSRTGSSDFGITPTAGTTNAGHVVSAITYTSNTVSNQFDGHVEGYVIIQPQPKDEWFNIDLWVGTGATNAVWIDKLKVGSNCIPEPGTLVLLGLAGGGVLLSRCFRQH